MNYRRKDRIGTTDSVFLFFPGGYTRTSAADSGATAQYAYSFKGWL
jgi:hypothetical protein